MLPEQLLRVEVVSPMWSETGGSSEGNLRAALGRPFWPAASRCFVSAALAFLTPKKLAKSMGRRCLGTFRAARSSLRIGSNCFKVP